MFKRITCCLVCVLLALVPALSLAETVFSMAGYDGEDSVHEWETNGFFTRMEQATGISFTFTQYNKSEQWKAAKQAMFAAGGQLPDVLFKADLTTSEMIRYSESGQLIDLKPLLSQHAPNLWALLQAHPDWLDAITLPNGKIVALPAINEIPTQDALWINKAWLDELGVAMPTDMQTLRTALEAIRDGDPNRNGRNDEIPLAFLGPWELKLFAHAYGVVANDYNIYLDEAGQVQYWPGQDSFFELAGVLRGMYADRLLDQTGFVTVDTLRTIRDEENAVNIYGAFFAPTPVSLVTYAMAADYVVLEPFAFEGRQIYRDLVGEVTRGTFAITSACEDPAALLGWVDMLYTEEGAIMAMLGNEGVEYVVYEDGAWDWKGGLANIDVSTLAANTVYDTGNMPWYFPNEFYARYTDRSVRHVTQELIKLDAYVAQPFPPYSLTDEQRAVVLPLQNELGRYVDEQLAGFVLGQIELNDENIAAFREGLKERGMDEMVAFWQAVADAK